MKKSEKERDYVGIEVREEKDRSRMGRKWEGGKGWQNGIGWKCHYIGRGSLKPKTDRPRGGNTKKKEGVDFTM